MKVTGIEHVQLAMPPGEEQAARGFYTGLEVIPDDPVNGRERCYVGDPFGNRIELMQA